MPLKRKGTSGYTGSRKPSTAEQSAAMLLRRMVSIRMRTARAAKALERKEGRDAAFTHPYLVGESIVREMLFRRLRLGSGARAAIGEAIGGRKKEIYYGKLLQLAKKQGVGKTLQMLQATEKELHMMLEISRKMPFRVKGAGDSAMDMFANPLAVALDSITRPLRALAHPAAELNELYGTRKLYEADSKAAVKKKDLRALAWAKSELARTDALIGLCRLAIKK